METLEYSNGEITILWKPKICKHAGVCVAMLPKVYDPKARPWIRAENATTQELINQVAKCPSGALSIKTDVLFMEKNRTMESTKVVLENDHRGEVQVFDGDLKAGKMDIAIHGGKLTVFHTEVDPKFEGRGFAKSLLNQLVRYAKEHALKIIPRCPYVHAQFQRHPAEYSDIWFNG